MLSRRLVPERFCVKACRRSGLSPQNKRSLAQTHRRWLAETLRVSFRPQPEPTPSAERVVHDIATLVGQRVFGIALGYEDLIDHDRLRHDPVLGVALGRLEARHGRCAPLAGKSTLNRLEHGVVAADRYRRIAHDGAAISATAWPK